MGHSRAGPGVDPEQRFALGTARRVRRRDSGELNLWDDYGMADSPEWYEVGEDAPPGERVGQLLGASVMPTAKTFTFLLVLGATLVILMLLVSLLLNLDALFFNRGGTAPAPAPTTAVAPTAAPEPTAEPEPEPEPAPEPTGFTSPSMLPGAKECAPGVWAGPQTSCPLAEAVAEQVDLEMTGAEIIEAFSPVTNQAYRVECVADEGISCTGLDGVVGVYVWLVTTS